MANAGVDLTLRHALGRSGALVSPLGLGTAALGADYGLGPAADREPPAMAQAVDIVHRALRSGINFFDTAPAYGRAEQIVGEALAGVQDVVIATKVLVGWDRASATAVEVLAKMRQSVEHSLRYLRRSRLDILQIHSASVFDTGDERIYRAFEQLRCEGLVGGTGFTVYHEEAALKAIASGAVDVVQIGFNLFDRRASRRVFGEATRGQVGVVARSVLLKGALSPRWRSLSGSFQPVKDVVARLCTSLQVPDEELPRLAIRYCLSHVPPMASVLIGAARVAELQEAVEAAGAGILPQHELATLAKFATEDERVVNPTFWP